MTATMNWDDMNFKASDVVKLVIGLVSLIWAISTVNNRIGNIADSQDLMRETQTEFIKDYKINQKAIENQLNAQGIEIKMQGMRIEALEKARK